MSTSTEEYLESLFWYVWSFKDSRELLITSASATESVGAGCDQGGPGNLSNEKT